MDETPDNVAQAATIVLEKLAEWVDRNRHSNSAQEKTPGQLVSDFGSDLWVIV